MKNKLIPMLVSAGLFAAVIFAVTGFLHVPIGAGGYIHVGDAFVFLAACLLPQPWAAAAAAVGGGLADALSGYVIWMPGTVVIKAATTLFFSSKGAKIFTVRNAFGTIGAAALCAAGYYLYEAALTQSFIVPLSSVPFSLIQAAASVAVYFAGAAALDRVKIKQKLERGFRHNEDF